MSLLPHPTDAQTKAIEAAREVLTGHRAVLIGGEAGSGRTLILETLQAEFGGCLLRAENAFKAFAHRDPAAMEEALIDLIAEAHADHDIVFFDDLDLVSVPTYAADRPGYSDQLFHAYFDRAAAVGKTIVLSGKASEAARFLPGIATVEIGGFGATDYRQILGIVEIQDSPLVRFLIQAP